MEPVYIEECDGFEAEAEFPREYFCPISNQLMKDPVLLEEDGHIYDRKSIEKWLKNSMKSPASGNEIKSATLTPASALKRRIRKEIRGKLEGSKETSAMWDNQAALKAWDRLHSFELEFDSDEEPLEFLSQRLRWIDNQPVIISESESKEELRLKQDMYSENYFDVSSMLYEGEKDITSLQKSLDGVSTPKPENAGRPIAELMGFEKDTSSSSTSGNNRMRVGSLMLSSGNSPLPSSSRNSLRRTLLQRGFQQNSAEKRISKLRPPPSSVPPISPPRTQSMKDKDQIIDNLFPDDKEEEKEEEELETNLVLVGKQVEITLGPKSGLRGVVEGRGKSNRRWRIRCDTTMGGMTMDIPKSHFKELISKEESFGNEDRSTLSPTLTTPSSKENDTPPETPIPFSVETPSMKTPTSLDGYVAKWKYKARDGDELEMIKGDIVNILSKKTKWGPGWWKGEIGGRVGLFPKTYVVPLKK